MALNRKNLDHPDETIEFENLARKLVELGDFTVGRYVNAPGWRWSTHVKPIVGGDWCQARHVGIIISGRLDIVFPDGTSATLEPNDVYDLGPGHDTYTIGDEPCVNVEWSGSRAFAGNRAGGNRELVTLMFTDLVGSTETAAQLGDVAWHSLLSAHFEGIRARILDFRGQEVKTTGDGFLARFTGPAQALACATRIGEMARRDGLGIRIGIHVGEVELVGADVRGIVVHEAARIMAQAAPHEILVSDLTRSLAASSGYEFVDRGTHALKGLPGEWQLFALKR